MIFDIWIKPLIAVIFCAFLLYRCFQPYFIDPEKAVKSEWIYNNTEKINIIGKIITAIMIIITVFFLIIPAAKDTNDMVSDNYVYAVVEIKHDYHSNSNSAKHDRVGVIIHDEYVYYPDENGIMYDRSKDVSEKPSEDFYMKLVDYKKGEYYLIKYLPNTSTAEAVCFLEDVEMYKTTPPKDRLTALHVFAGISPNF